MTTNYDVIIIGGGHNGLVCACALAYSGKKVLLLEQRAVLGGVAATEEIFPNYFVNTGAVDAGLFLPEIIEKFRLIDEGLTIYQSDVASFAPQPDGSAFALWRNLDRTVEMLKNNFSAEAKQLKKFNRYMNKMRQALRTILLHRPPQLPNLSFYDLIEWAEPLWKVRNLGRADMLEFMRMLPLSASELLDEWFDNPALKGLFASTGITGSYLGPRAAGTALLMLYHYTGRENGGFRSSWFVRGGMGKLMEALGSVAEKYKAEIRLNTHVEKILINDQGEAVGVRTADGEKIFARKVVSNADARTTFLKLVGTLYLDTPFVRAVQNIRYRGVTARLNLALSKVPAFTAAAGNLECLKGHIIIAPSVNYLEKAADAAKYGQFSPEPYLDVVIPTLNDPTLSPENTHIMSITMQYAPYHLRDGSWDTHKSALRNTIITTLSQYAPDLPDCIVHEQLITPLEWEKNYGLTEGCIHHGQMMLDQLLFMRPIPGWGNYRTPIKNLYLCGADNHPGGGVTGAPGWLASREILRD
jgi:phytoene dehydrogenase-like protein